ncbi:hypothetical protein ACRQ5Q_22545 [Bradyrhizobium sp. PMVTL-01]|uniref:hypothetical protein n=1 Tax=Bradyrhizobium sp. PMVTL-01 TaxID=3434999 RepID=UPI003F71FE12
MGLSKKSLALFFVGCAGMGAVVTAIVSATADQRRPAPDRAAMRAFRVTSMSDDQIRTARRAAQERLEFIQQADRRAEEEARLARRDLLQKCADVVYATRNTAECSPRMPLTAGLKLRLPSLEDLFEEELLGVCAYVSNRAEAIERKCIRG